MDTGWRHISWWDKVNHHTWSNSKWKWKSGASSAWFFSARWDLLCWWLGIPQWPLFWPLQFVLLNSLYQLIILCSLKVFCLSLPKGLVYTVYNPILLGNKFPPTPTNNDLHSANAFCILLFSFLPTLYYSHSIIVVLNGLKLTCKYLGYV